MGQYGNQPDFITTDIKSIDALNGFVSDTPSEASYLGGSLIYIGGQDGTKNLSAIPAGVVGASTITKLVSPGYAGSSGSGYTAANGVATTTTGAGINLTVDITVSNGAVATIEINVAGTGYKNGDLITVNQVGSGVDAVFRVVAAPGLPTILDAIAFALPPQGAWFPVPVDYVMATGTTVTLLVAGK